MLSFEVEPEHGQVRIYADRAGLELLEKELGFLLAGDPHSHLMTPSWGGSELAEAPQDPRNRLVHQVEIRVIDSIADP